jgi:WD40 repeat protein
MRNLATAFVALFCAAFLPAQTVLYVASGNGNLSSLYTVNPLTAQSTLIGAVLINGVTPVVVTGLALQPGTGVLFGVSGSEYEPSRQLLTINTLTGFATSLGTIGIARLENASDITFAADGTLFGWNVRGGPLLRIDPTNATRTVIGSAMNGTQGNGLAFTPNGTLYLAGPTTGSLYTVNTSTGAITSVAALSNLPLNFGTGFNALTSDPNGVLYGTGRGSGAQLVTIDTTTGVITSVGVLSFGEADALAFGFAPVPEPSTWALMLLGLLAVGWRRFAREGRA